MTYCRLASQKAAATQARGTSGPAAARRLVHCSAVRRMSSVNARGIGVMDRRCPMLNATGNLQEESSKWGSPEAARHRGPTKIGASVWVSPSSPPWRASSAAATLIGQECGGSPVNYRPWGTLVANSPEEGRSGGAAPSSYGGQRSPQHGLITVTPATAQCCLRAEPRQAEALSGTEAISGIPPWATGVGRPQARSRGCPDNGAIVKAQGSRHPREEVSTETVATGFLADARRRRASSKSEPSAPVFGR